MTTRYWILNGSQSSIALSCWPRRLEISLPLRPPGSCLFHDMAFKCMELSFFDYIVSLYHCYCHCCSYVFVYYYITVFAMSMSIMKKYIYSKVIFFGTNILNMLLLWLSVVYYDALYWNVHHTQTHTHTEGQNWVSQFLDAKRGLKNLWSPKS